MFNEKGLIKRVQDKGDSDAASKLIANYYLDIYMYVIKQTKNEELSKDLTQDICIAILRSIESFDVKKASFKTWIYKISSNKIIDYYRSKYYKYTTIVDTIEEYNITDIYNLESEVQLKAEAKEVIDIINTLSSNIQQIIRLKIFGEMTFKEIAKVLELSESTIKTRYYGTIKIIQRELGGKQ